MQNYISFENIIDTPENTFTTVQYDMTDCERANFEQLDWATLNTFHLKLL